MTREEHLKFCRTCTNRKLDIHKGVVCNLTGDIASFESTCATYEVDTSEKQHINGVLHAAVVTSGSDEHGFFGSWKSALLMSALGFVRAAMKGFGDPFGLIFLFLGIAWFIAALARSNKE